MTPEQLRKAMGLPNYGNPTYRNNQGAGGGQMLPDSRGRQRMHWMPLPSAAPNPQAPAGQIGTAPAQGQSFGFSSNQQDPQWDRARRIRAVPAIMAHQRFKSEMKSYRRNPFASSASKPVGPAAPPAELAGYVGKSFSWGDLAKGEGLAGYLAYHLPKFRAAVRAQVLQHHGYHPDMPQQHRKLLEAHVDKNLDHHEPQMREHLTGEYHGAIRHGRALMGLDKLAKFDEGKHPRAEDGKFTSGGDAPVERRAKGLAGLAPRLKLSSTFNQYRADPNDPEWSGAKDEPLPMSGVMESKFRPHAPKAMDRAEVTRLARYAGARTAELRETIVTRATNKGMIPEGTDPKDVRRAFNHARNLAMHDVGVGDYTFRFNPEHIDRFRPLLDFMFFARKRMANTMREEQPGAWAPYRREFGTPFKPAKFYEKDTAGQKAGEEKKAFYRHDKHVMVKHAPAIMAASLDLLAKAAPAHMAMARLLRARPALAA